MRVGLPISSPRGLRFLMVYGAFLAACSAFLLVYAVMQSWGFAGLEDRAIQLLLLLSTVFGAALVASARATMHRR